MTELPPHEQEVLDRLSKYNPLGWKPHHRSDAGNGVLRAVLPAGPGKLKVCDVELSPSGMAHAPARVIDAN